VTSPKPPELLQISVAVLDGRIGLTAFYISRVSQGALCLGLSVPSQFDLHKLPLQGNLQMCLQI